MGYKRAEEVLPKEIIALIQQFVDGASIYIPRRTEKRQAWGDATQIREELRRRNTAIYRDYLAGSRVGELADKYYLSEKSIWRIVREMKKTA